MDFPRPFEAIDVSVTFRNSCWQVLFKKAVVKSFAKFTTKHLYQRLFLQTVKAANWLHLIPNFDWSRRDFLAIHVTKRSETLGIYMPMLSKCWWAQLAALTYYLISLQSLKKILLQRCSPMNFMKFFRATFLQNTLGWLLLKIIAVTKSSLSTCMCFKESFFQKLWDNRFRQGHLW